MAYLQVLIAVPISLEFNAGASLTPSPVCGSKVNNNFLKKRKRGTYDSDDIIALFIFSPTISIFCSRLIRKNTISVYSCSEISIPVVYRKLLHVVASQSNRLDGIIDYEFHQKLHASTLENTPFKFFGNGSLPLPVAATEVSEQERLWMVSYYSNPVGLYSRTHFF